MLRSRPVLATFCLASLLGGASASAQMPITGADRPGVTDPPTILPVGALQLEGGVKLERETGGDDPDTDKLTVPDLLIRIGLLERLELRLAADGLLYEFRKGAGDRALASDFSAGTKVRLFRERGFLPETSLLVELSFPVGSEAATSAGFDPELTGLYQWSLGEETALAVNTGLSVPTQGSENDRRIFQFDPRVSFERQLTPTIGAFLEYYGEVKTGGVADEHSLAGGLTWLLVAQKVQLDVSGGGGLNDTAPDWFVSAGVSMRFRMPWAK